MLKRVERNAEGRPQGRGADRGGAGGGLAHFGIEAKVVGTVAGPHVTRYELRLAPGVKMSKVASLKDDLAYALAATDVRILAPIPGKQAVGVEVPNTVRKMVHLGDVFQEAPNGWSPLTVWLGKDIAGKAIGTDLAKQPHILVAGTTGSGKSGCVNAMLSSILLRASPNEVRLVLVDPKQVELNHYESIPHLMTPVVTSPRMAANVLQNLIREMEERYTVMSAGAHAQPRRAEPGAREATARSRCPYILCVIDELADLMMVAPAEVEDSIIRLAQKSRAVGIHLLLATQRPSADIITGMIKANVPARIAFAVSSQTDSRVILDQNGAESLLGQGDMLFRPATESRPARIQGAFIDEERDREAHRPLAQAGRAGDARGAARGGRARGGRRRPRDFDPDADDLLGEAIATVVQMGTRVDLDASAPPARRLHPRGPADRHDGAPRRDLGLRGLEGAPGTDHRGRSATRARGAGGTRRSPLTRTGDLRMMNAGIGREQDHLPVRPELEPVRQAGSDGGTARGAAGRDLHVHDRVVGSALEDLVHLESHVRETFASRGEPLPDTLVSAVDALVRAEERLSEFHVRRQHVDPAAEVAAVERLVADR